MMKQQTHVLNQIPDYVLDLLPQGERQSLEQHAFTCADCRRALRQESDFARAVQETLTIATQPPADLRAFIPDVKNLISPRPQPFLTLIWQKQLVPAALLVIMLLGSFGLYRYNRHGVWSDPAPTSLAVTATMTDAPTLTMTETQTEPVMAPMQTAVATLSSQPNISATPAPNPTPIAALRPQIAAN